MKYLVFSFVLILFAFPAVVVAQTANVTPWGWDFGDVLVGETATKVFGIESLDPLTPVELGAIEIRNDPFSAFTVSLLDTIPAELYVEDGPFNIEVSFTPTSTGPYDAVLHIETNDTHHYPPAGHMVCALSGQGVSNAVPEPGSLAIWSLLSLAGLAYAWRKRKA